MIVKLHYTTCEGGIWREFYSDEIHEGRMKYFLLGLSTPLPHKMTTITASMSGLKDMIVVHSFRFSDGITWDAKNGMRVEKTPISCGLSGSYDEVWKDYKDEESY